MFHIKGMYRGRTEIIDSFDTMKEARRNLGEYSLAFGFDWNLWIEEE